MLVSKAFGHLSQSVGRLFLSLQPLRHACILCLRNLAFTCWSLVLEPAQKLPFQGGTTRRPIGLFLNTEPTFSPRTSPSKAETSTWWQRTSTCAYSRLPRKPYQEEQEETTDHTGVKNYKTSRMHCQKPEQQLKPILHRSVAARKIVRADPS